MNEQCGNLCYGQEDGNLVTVCSRCIRFIINARPSGRLGHTLEMAF